MAKPSAAGTWRGACRPEHYNLDYNRFNGVADEGEDLAPGEANMFADMLRNPNVPPQLKEAFRLSQVAKQTKDPAAQARADELVRAAIMQGGPEIQKRFEETLGDMTKDNRMKEKLGETGGVMPSAKEFLAGKGLVADSFLDDDKAPGDLKGKIQSRLDSTQNVMEKLAKTQASLENIQSPDQMADFFQTLGWTEEEVERAAKDEEFAKQKMMGELEKLMPSMPSEPSQIDKLLGEMDNFLEDTKDVPAKRDALREERKKVSPASETKKPAPARAPASASAPPAVAAYPPAEAPKKAPAAAPVAAAAAPAPSGAPAPSREIAREAAEVVVTIRLPGVTSMAALELGTEAGKLCVNAVPPAGCFAPVRVAIPADADAANPAARFSK